MQEKTQLQKEITELKFNVETNEEFNRQTQENARNSYEMLLYYQQSLYEMLESTGIMNDLGDESILSEEKKVALQEIIDLNKERIKQDEEMQKTYVNPDEKKRLKRLEKFVKAFHDVILIVDFKSIFENYSQVVQ